MFHARYSRRRVLAGGTASLAAGALALPRRARAADELNALVWCDHTDPNLLGPFEEANGVKINTKEFGSTGEALAVLEQSQPGDWDVLVLDTVDINRLASAGHLAALSAADYPMADIFPEVQAPEFNGKDGKVYGVTEKFGYNCFSYNNQKVDPADMRKSAVMWDGKYAGRIAVYDYYNPVVAMVAIGLGIKPNALKAGDLPAIKEKLLAMKKQAALVGDVATVQNALVTGSADIVVGGGEYAVAGMMSENPALDWVLPDEGGVRWMQSLAIFKDSKKPDLATKFMQYILSPEGQARLATSACYWAMPANKNATLTDAQKKTLRWDEQPAFLAKSY
ncbi:MAG TPA: spermidine/putrescine ABC transporter substrate-binding protein, partial [Dongiaceae bacterium]|nr:spermidine/putrescine ABC transporter substrate-binding protein [Dongiaceae bacterium]